MSILQKLKSLLGLGDDSSKRHHDRDVGVTVERESGRPDEPADVEADATDEGAAAGSSASSSTDAMVESTESPEEAAEPAEATGPTPADATPTAEKAGQSVDPVPVEDIKGIGPAYSDRLAAAGVETVSDLAAADAADLAQETDISEKRLQGWIDRAQVR